MKGNIDVAISEVVDHMQRSGTSRAAIELSPEAIDYIDSADLRHILTLFEEKIDERAAGEFEIISSASLPIFDLPAPQRINAFTDFVQEQDVDTIILVKMELFSGGVKFNLNVSFASGLSFSPNGGQQNLTTLISASEEYLLLDSPEHFKGLAPTKAMELVARDLLPYLSESAEQKFDSPFADDSNGENSASDDLQLSNYLKSLARTEIENQWQKQDGKSGFWTLLSTLGEETRNGPWNIAVKLDERPNQIVATVNLSRDGFIQTSRLVGIGKDKIEAKYLDHLEDLSIPTEQASSSAEKSYFAKGKAVINPNLISQEALTAAKLLARARAISAALHLPPPQIGLVQNSTEIPKLIHYLNAGLPYGEIWKVQQKDDIIEVESELKIIPLEQSSISTRLLTAVLKSGDPLQLEVRSGRPSYFGLFGWQADGTVIRIFPFQDNERIRLNSDGTTYLPSRKYGLSALTSVPLDGAQSNHEALILVTSDTPLDLSDLAQRVAHADEDFAVRGHMDSLFFDGLTQQIKNSIAPPHVRFVPFQVIR
nr:DUF4384 domain-containing protein [uncultured Cohaesibacter sp.]